MLTLLQIQKLQFSDKQQAEQELKAFLSTHQFDSVKSVHINTKPESLNSLNGIVTLECGNRYFFKTHVEENEQLADYYNAQLLESAGYPVLHPRQLESRPGQQIALYEIVSLPTLFDEIKAAEDTLLSDGTLNKRAYELLELNEKLDKKVFECYLRTYEGKENSTSLAPIHQLFGHRLAPGGRVDLYYKDQQITLERACLTFEQFSATKGKVTVGQTSPIMHHPISERSSPDEACFAPQHCSPTTDYPLIEQSSPDMAHLTFEQLAQRHWIINGIRYSKTLAELIALARQQLDTTKPSISVIGHGDAHNGNIFVADSKHSMLYFDPAFAGRHNPFLDLTKPLFHNVFARWMYFPEQAAAEFELAYEVSEHNLSLVHNYQPSLLREKILTSKLTNVLNPLIDYLQSKGINSQDWQPYLRSALMCCPLLTVNLFAPAAELGTLSQRYSTKIKLLGLAMTIMLASPVESADEKDPLQCMIDKIFEHSAI